MISDLFLCKSGLKSQKKTGLVSVICTSGYVEVEAQIVAVGRGDVSGVYGFTS